MNESKLLFVGAVADILVEHTFELALAVRVPLRDAECFVLAAARVFIALRPLVEIALMLQVRSDSNRLLARPSLPHEIPHGAVAFRFACGGGRVSVAAAFRFASRRRQVDGTAALDGAGIAAPDVGLLAAEFLPFRARLGQARAWIAAACVRIFAWFLAAVFLARAAYPLIRRTVEPVPVHFPYRANHVSKSDGAINHIFQQVAQPCHGVFGRVQPRFPLRPVDERIRAHLPRLVIVPQQRDGTGKRGDGDNAQVDGCDGGGQRRECNGENADALLVFDHPPIQVIQPANENLDERHEGGANRAPHRLHRLAAFGQNLIHAPPALCFLFADRAELFLALDHLFDFHAATNEQVYRGIVQTHCRADVVGVAGIHLRKTVSQVEQDVVKVPHPALRVAN